jgi:hypothetical protein
MVRESYGRNRLVGSINALSILDRADSDGKGK